MWKRRQAILKWEWDLSDNEDVEEIRPEFEASVKSRRLKNLSEFFLLSLLIKIVTTFYRLNPITKVMEAYVSGREKTLRVTMTTALVIFMVSFTVP